ncbi:MAG: DUF333 domain-containing protein [Paracoccus sp. (in: a-proteobacteria)]|nr:DUF333 domain-containing protein [Paracoccus sp. (in: a-proteobacteria)]
MRIKSVTVAAATLTLAACVTEEAPVIGAPNPASVYCIEQGGRLEIRRTAEGDAGYCHLPDGRVVEEWALFRAANG